MQSHPAEWMIWEAPPLPDTAAQLKARGVGIAVFYPCGNVSPEADYMETMRQNVERLRLVFDKPD